MNPPTRPLTSIPLSFTGRRELAWRLRHERRWPIVRIATKLGVKRAAVYRLLHRVADDRERGTPDVPASWPEAGPPPTPPRLVRALSLAKTYQA